MINLMKMEIIFDFSEVINNNMKAYNRTVHIYLI